MHSKTRYLRILFVIPPVLFTKTVAITCVWELPGIISRVERGPFIDCV